MRATSGMFKHVRKMLDLYSQYHPSVLTMRQFLDFGAKNACEKTSYTFLRKELPVRLANIMKEINLLPEQLVQQPSARIVQGWYEKSFQEILKFEKIQPAEPNALHDFCDTLVQIRNRHTHVVETMAEGVIEMKAQNIDDAQPIESQIQYFLDRFYMSRISIRMLINQHTLLFGKQDERPSRHVGAIDPTCDVLAVAEDAFHNARFLCEQYYMASPSVNFRCIRPGSDQDERICMTYVPSHLYHILFELFKNAMRAVVEHHQESAKLPPLEVLVVQGGEDISIRIGDQGGGIPRSAVDQLFNYMYSTAPRPPSPQSAMAAPLAGYGYGLPLSRLYAKYFNGDLKLSSVEGFGTDATVFMKVLTNEAAELLPVYNTTSESHYKSSMPVGDWSDPTQTKGLHGAVHQISQTRSHHNDQLRHAARQASS